MTPKEFDYVSPSTLEEAVRFLGSSEDCKVLAGGQSLVPLMKLRLASPKLLVGINNLRGLSYIEEDPQVLRIGAMSRYAEVLESSVATSRFPILKDSISGIADALVRNRGTIGGNICHADPASDLLPVMLALDARFKICGAEGGRTIESKDFFLDVFTPDLKPAEILTEILLPIKQESYGAYLKFSEVSGGFATVGVAVEFVLKERVCASARIAAAAVAQTPVRLSLAEDCLVGKELSRENFKEAADVAADSVDPKGDIYGSTRYRKQLVRVLVFRALELAMSRSLGAQHQ
ncbi:MAG: FAD binding domain-containing protein [Nitrososphaerales archaeon]